MTILYRLQGFRKSIFSLVFFFSGLLAPCFSQCFRPTFNFPTGQRPNSVGVADFNGDGHLDLATDGGNGTTISILLGSGNGTFAPAIPYEAGPYSGAIETGDFNGDTRPDLVMGNTNSNTVTVLVNQGDGSFGAPKLYVVGVFPTSIDTGDINGDGKLDLAVTNLITNNISLLMGVGDGTFVQSGSVTVNSLPNAVVIGDMNGDGKPDLITTNQGGSNYYVSVLMNLGNGSFAPSQNYPAGPVPLSLAANDLNGDGKLDIAVSIGIPSSVMVFLNDGAGSLAVPDTYTIGDGYPTSLTVGDFNGDRKPDLATVNMSGNTIAVLMNSGNGQFGAPIRYNTGSNPTKAELGDFNEDGRPDLAVVISFADHITLFLNCSTAPLPVNLINFSAQPLDDININLSWITASEQDNDYFLLERSKDLVAIEPLGQIRSREGSTFQTNTYSFTDGMPHRGTSYYRLRQVDRSGRSVTYPWASVVLRKQPYGVYPNPINHQPLTLQVDEPQTAWIGLYSLEGKRIPFRRLDSGKESIQLIVDQPLPGGIYMLRVEERAQIRRYRLISN